MPEEAKAALRDTSLLKRKIRTYRKLKKTFCRDDDTGKQYMARQQLVNLAQLVFKLFPYTGTIRTRKFSITEKYLYAIRHTRPATLLVSPQRPRARSAVVFAFRLASPYPTT